jgi:predicted transcriptional regulator
MAFKNTKGVKKKPYRKAGKYGTAERRVLDALSGYLNILGVACPSVPTIARKADCSDRTVQLALGKLCDQGRLQRVGRSGPKYRNTFMYVFPKISPQISPKEDRDIEDIKNSFFKNNIETSAGALEQRQTEANAHREKENNQQPTPLTPLPTPKKSWPTGTCWRSGERPELLVRESRLVKTWKTENEKAGFGTPTMSAKECSQIRQITRGKDGLDYVEFVDSILPCVIGHWAAFKGFWRSMHMINAQGPANPHTGFLLRHRGLAERFYKEMKAAADPKYFISGCLNFYAPKPKKKKKSYMPFDSGITWKKKSEPKQSLDELVKQFNQLVDQQKAACN